MSNADSETRGWRRETIINEQTQEKSFVYKHPDTPFSVLSREGMRKWWLWAYPKGLHVFDSLSDAKRAAHKHARERKA